MDAVPELTAWREGLPKPYSTLEGAGSLLGVSGVQMYRYETGKRRIPPEKVMAISAITHVEPAVLRPDIFGKPDFERLKKKRPKAEAHAS